MLFHVIFMSIFMSISCHVDQSYWYGTKLAETTISDAEFF